MGRMLLILVFLMFFFKSSAQYLLLQKKNRPYQVIFEEGEYLRFKIKGEKFWRRALIQGFEDDEVVFHYFSLHKDDFALIDVSNKKFTVFSFTSGPGKLMIAGVAFIAIDQLNQTAINNQKFGISSKTALIGGGITASGIVLRLIQKKRWKLHKSNHMISIIN